MRAKIYPYKKGSKSAKALADALGIKRIKLDGSKFVGKAGDFIINWGSSKLPVDIAGDAVIINEPECVALAANKFKTFEALNQYGVSIPPFTDNLEEAKAWPCVVERHLLNGHSGAGIKIKQKGEVLEPCPLYVKYIPKKSEWRIHVVMGNVIAVQRKARSRDVPDEKVDWKVRNHDNGFIFARNEGAEPPYSVVHHAVNAVEALGLDMGAVDVIFNEKNDQAYVLEVNTACGLEGETVNDYANALGKILRGEENVQLE